MTMNKQNSLDSLKHFLTLQSISTDLNYLGEMQKTRHFLKDLLINLGFEVKFLKGVKHDAVFAERITDSSLKTVLIYGHYDVQPPDPLNEWLTPPFEPTIKNKKLSARGATDNKGQILIHIMAVKELIDKLGHKNLPCNFKFIIEGEEEIGSLSVESFAKNYSKDLLFCDYLFVSDGELLNGKDPAIEISLRGLLYTEVSIQTSKHDLHSGIFGGVAENPAQILCEIISKLKNSGKIQIPNFYKEVIHPSQKELKDYKALKISKQEIIKEGGLFGLSQGEKEFTLNERRWSRPTLDVNGFISGFTLEGAKTIIPSKASAKISMRLVPNQNAEKIFKDFKKFILKNTPKGCKSTITLHSSALPYKAPTDHPIFENMKKSLKKVFKKDAIFLGVGGSIGFIPVITKSLKVPAILVGFGSVGVMHTPNEYISVDNFYKGIETMTDFYKSLSKK